MMTKKHFIAFARAIADATSGFNGSLFCYASVEERLFAARVVAEIASRDNPRFDREKFFKACGLE